MPHMAEHPLSKHGEPRGGGPRRWSEISSERALCELFLNGFHQPLDHLIALRLVRGLDHHPDDRFGPRWAHQPAPAAAEPLRLAVDGLPDLAGAVESTAV